MWGGGAGEGVCCMRLAVWHVCASVSVSVFPDFLNTATTVARKVSLHGLITVASFVFSR